ncbi:MAG: hypothetical protein GF401_15290 [Chitinivibrionales bacterium]|nr:hypothetical protein [Chitinivibrionales bacterium]
MKKSVRNFLCFFNALALTIAFYGCAHNKGVVKRTRVPVQHEKIFLMPIENNSGVESLEGWPGESAYQHILMRSFQTIHEDLLIEFRRCEKYGLYEMTDDSLQATVYVKTTLKGHTITSDTLKIPVSVEVFNTATNDKHSFVLNAYTPIPPQDPDRSSFNNLGLLFACFRRNFPCRRLVSEFYPGKEEK